MSKTYKIFTTNPDREKKEIIYDTGTITETDSFSNEYFFNSGYYRTLEVELQVSLPGGVSDYEFSIAGSNGEDVPTAMSDIRSLNTSVTDLIVGGDLSTNRTGNSVITVPSLFKWYGLKVRESTVGGPYTFTYRLIVRGIC